MRDIAGLLEWNGENFEFHIFFDEDESFWYPVFHCDTLGFNENFNSLKEKYESTVIPGEESRDNVKAIWSEIFNNDGVFYTYYNDDELNEGLFSAIGKAGNKVKNLKNVDGKKIAKKVVKNTVGKAVKKGVDAVRKAGGEIAKGAREDELKGKTLSPKKAVSKINDEIDENKYILKYGSLENYWKGEVQEGKDYTDLLKDKKVIVKGTDGGPYKRVVILDKTGEKVCLRIVAPKSSQLFTFNLLKESLLEGDEIPEDEDEDEVEDNASKEGPEDEEDENPKKDPLDKQFNLLKKNFDGVSYFDTGNGKDSYEKPVAKVSDTENTVIWVSKSKLAKESIGKVFDYLKKENAEKRLNFKKEENVDTVIKDFDPKEGVDFKPQKLEYKK